MATLAPPPVRLLDHLPALFRRGGGDGAPAFLERFLLPFEALVAELEAGIGSVHDTFDPDETGADFLDWLAGWVALSLRADLGVERRREFVREAVTLYRIRGTRRGLERLLYIHTGLPAEVNDLSVAFQVGVSSRVGDDTLIDGGAPHFFRVLLRVPPGDPERIRWYREVATAVIDQEKPAHTRYLLDLFVPSMQIGVHSQVGIDTLLGSSGAASINP